MMLGNKKGPLMLAIQDTSFSKNVAELGAPLPSPTHIWVFAFLSSREGTDTS